MSRFRHSMSVKHWVLESKFSMPPKVLIIRPQEQALETQSQLAAMGINSDILSLTSYVYYHRRAQIIEALQQTNGVLLTSAHALDPFKTLPPSLFSDHLCLVTG